MYYAPYGTLFLTQVKNGLGKKKVPVEEAFGLHLGLGGRERSSFGPRRDQNGTFFYPRKVCGGPNDVYFRSEILILLIVFSYFAHFGTPARPSPSWAKFGVRGTQRPLEPLARSQELIYVKMVQTFFTWLKKVGLICQ